MKKDIIKGIVRDFHESELPSSKKRELSIPVATGKIITLSGVRRSGKTFILFETIKSLLSSNIPITRILYINFEDERIDLKKNDLDLIIQSYRELCPDISLSECYFFFDEVQNIQDWEKFIRRIYDSISKNIFITGSNSKLLSREIATSLRGRTVTYEVFPLSFSEYLRFYDIKPDIHHSQTRAKIAGLFENFLYGGGFPEITHLKDNSFRSKVLQEYFDVMLYRDLVERFGITNTNVLKYFIKRLFENITSPLSVNNIYNELKSQGYKVGKNSLYDYLDAAVSIYMFLIAKKQTESVLKQELGEKKVYSIDNGLLNAVTFKYSKDYGKLLENAIFMELYKSGRQIVFYKDKRECDFIAFEKSGAKSIIQSAYSIEDLGTRQREIEGLMDACKRLSADEGFIITNSEEEDINWRGLSIKVVPAYKFMLTLTPA